MKELFLEDYANLDQDSIKADICGSYEIDKSDLEDKQIILAYESVGSWGCDSSAYVLFVDNKTGILYENHASHCSCYGFEGQWEPEEVTPEYLVKRAKDKDLFWTGGYDDNSEENIKKASNFILEMFA